MMRSLFSGVSGLRVHQTKMDVIGNNISNVNTVGYKSSRVTFNEVFTQTLSGASAANPSTGKAGTNPMQIGLGSNVATIDKLMTTGAAQRTDNPLDVMINGPGFIGVSDASGTYFTRAGNMIEDEDGNLSINGMKVMGWDAIWDTSLKEYKIQKSTASPIVIGGDKDYVSPQPTSQIDFAGNLNKNDSPIQRTMSIYDSIGNRYSVQMEMVYDKKASDAANTDPDPTKHVAIWKYVFGEQDPANAYVAYDPADATAYLAAPRIVNAVPYGDDKHPVVIKITVGDTAIPSPAIADTIGTLVFDSFGNLSSAKDLADATVDKVKNRSIIINLPTGGLSPAASFGVAGANKLTLNFADTTQFGITNTNVKATAKDGYSSGKRESLTVGPDGKVYGTYSNGMRRLLAQIPVATFKNPAGLEKVGSNLFLPTSNSGEFDGTGDEGEFLGGVLEMANVDLAAEFTEMITTQRGFQANSRIITVSDDMLQELTNLKR